MTLQQLIRLGTERQLPETGLVIVLGAEDTCAGSPPSWFSSARSSAGLHRQHCVKS